MPIRRDLKLFYGKQWKETRERILKRAKGCCGQCGKPDRQIVFTYTFNGRMFWSLNGEEWKDEHFHSVFNVWESGATGLPRRIRAILSVALGKRRAKTLTPEERQKGGRMGGAARANALPPDVRRSIASKAARARWGRP